MAIYGAGSVWDGEEVNEQFFVQGRFIVGWNNETGGDLQASLASLKIGDIIYLKGNRPGSRSIRVKGIGFVTRSFMECVRSGDYPPGRVDEWESFFVGVRWVVQQEFRIVIPENVGRLTNIRAATFYEEPLAFVQIQILERIFSALAGQ